MKARVTPTPNFAVSVDLVSATLPKPISIRASGLKKKPEPTLNKLGASFTSAAQPGLASGPAWLSSFAYTCDLALSLAATSALTVDFSFTGTPRTLVRLAAHKGMSSSNTTDAGYRNRNSPFD